MQSISLLRSQAYIQFARFAVLNCIAFSDSPCSSVSAQFRQRSMQGISLLRSQAYIRFARFAVPFSKPAEAGENGLGTFSPAPRVRSESIRSDKHKKTGIMPVFCAWRRARDSNPRGCYTLLAFQASSLATRSTLQVSKLQLHYLLFTSGFPRGCATAVKLHKLDIGIGDSGSRIIGQPSKCRSLRLHYSFLLCSVSKSITNIAYRQGLCKQKSNNS